MKDDSDLLEWEEDCRGEFQVDHENEAFLKLVLLAGILGWQHVAFGMEYPSSVAAPPFSFYSNFLDNWRQTFLDRSGKNHGSKVCYGKRASEPLPGRGDYFWTREDFMREADACNVDLTWTNTIKGRGNSTILVGLGGLQSERRDVERKTRILVDVAAKAMEVNLLRKNLPQCFTELNEQERQYLSWVLDGKTSDVIATIMGIRESQVKYMQRTLPTLFERQGIYPTAFFAYRLGLL